MQAETLEPTRTRRLVKTSVPGVYKRGDRYVVRFRDPSGKQRKRFARTLAEARDLKAALRADVVRGEYRALSRISFAEYAPEWISSYQGRTSRGFRESTRQEYRRDLERDAIPFFGRMRLAEIEPRHLKRFAEHLATSRGLAPGSVRLVLATVRALFATAVEEGVIRSNPAAGLRIAQRIETEGSEEKRKAMTEEELRTFLAVVPAEWRLFFEFLAHTGLRISEALALTWADLDLGRRRVRVRRAWRNGSFAPPKSKYGRREVPLSPRLSQGLWDRRKESTFRSDDDPVFASSTGTPLDAQNIFARVLKPAARQAGVPWIGFHSFRHTCATILFKSGLNAKQVQVWLGHHSPSFTLDVYVHLLADELPDPTFLDDLTGTTARESQDADAAGVAGLPRVDSL